MVKIIWLIPFFPLLAAGLTALAKQRHRKFAVTLAIGAMVAALILSGAAFISALQHPGQGEPVRQVFNFNWFQISTDTWLQLGFVLDPLTGVMLMMVSFVGLLIFI